jgi:hypothetical protein
MLIRVCVLIFAAVLVMLQGCVAIQTFPIAARAGDTITLAVGSPDGMTKTNTTVQFVSGSTTVNLPIRAIIRLRPDNTSFIAAYNGLVAGITNFAGHGPWLSTIVLDLPTGLPVGNSTLRVTTGASYEYAASVNNIPISLEILPGTGAPNTFTYHSGSADPLDVDVGNLLDLEPSPQVVIRPPRGDTSKFAAAEFKVNVQAQNKDTLALVPEPLGVKVVLDDSTQQNITTQLQMNWNRVGDIYTVNLIAPTGAAAISQTRFSVLLSRYSLNQFVKSPAPAVTSVKFFDVNGSLITTLPVTATNYTATVE